jgi:hypothetical protein
MMLNFAEIGKLAAFLFRGGSYPTKPVYDGQKAAVQDDDLFA